MGEKLTVQLLPAILRLLRPGLLLLPTNRRLLKPTFRRARRALRALTPSGLLSEPCAADAAALPAEHPPAPPPSVWSSLPRRPWRTAGEKRPGSGR